MSKYVIQDGWRFPFYELFYMVLGGALVGFGILLWNIPEFELPEFDRAKTEETSQIDPEFAEHIIVEENYKPMLIDPEQLEKLADPTPTFSKDEPDLATPSLEELKEKLVGEREPTPPDQATTEKVSTVSEVIPFRWSYLGEGYNSVYQRNSVLLQPQAEKPAVKEVVAKVTAPMPTEVEPTETKLAETKKIEPKAKEPAVVAKKPAPEILKAEVPMDKPVDKLTEKPEAKQTPAVRVVASTETEATVIGEDFFTIRVGVFIQDESVGKVFKQLKDQGYDPFKKQKFRAGFMRSYVYVGRFKNREEADRFHSEFKQKTNLNSIVTYHHRFNEL